MPRKLFSLFVLVFLLSSCKNEEKVPSEILIIPQPQEVVQHEGFYRLSKDVKLVGADLFPVTSEFFKVFIRDGASLFKFSDEGNSDITFVKDVKLPQEGYLLDIQPNEIVITASTDNGAFYAIQSLRQLLPEAIEDGSFREDEIKIPCVTIKDHPQFKYRGMHLDVGRHMFSVDFIKKYIDALAMLKMNTFHWHLTEDQGWRIEIKKYPKLQDVAAFRDQTLIGHYSDQPQKFDGKRYGGYYKQEEVKDIVAYALSRHVTVIPEIEMPGHSQAAITAYPELGCDPEGVKVAEKWGVFEEIYCPKEETFQFLEDVLDEVMALFPSKYIHIGGDEAPKSKWKSCPRCQRRIAQEGLKDEHELQNYFITRIEKYLNSKGRQIIGWDEILEGGLAPNATVMSWRGINGAVEAAKQNHNVILTPTSHVYFDYYQSENENEPLAIGGFLPLEKVYSFNPIPEELTKEESQFVLGAQGNIWTEYMPTSQQVEYMAFPRILAMSEVVWTTEDNKDYANFVKRVEHFHKRLDALKINYANHLYQVEGQVTANENGIFYELETLTEGKQIMYTTDGSPPNLFSNVYKEPITVTEDMTIRSIVSDGEQLLGSEFSENIKLHKAVGANITINKKPHRSYQGSGAQGLINGISGSDKRYGDKEWLGFWGEDIEIVIDLGEEMEINKIKTRFHNGNGQWIYAPEKIEVSFDEGQDIYFTSINTNDLIAKCWMILENKRARFVHLKIPNYGIIPEGKQGAGNPAWTFIDEIIIN